jgi:hypothetical protein
MGPEFTCFHAYLTLGKPVMPHSVLRQVDYLGEICA